MTMSARKSDAKGSGASSSPPSNHALEKIHRTISQTHSTSDVVLEETTLAERAYFQERCRNRVYDVVVTAFLESGIKKAELAKRISKRPEQLTRLLSNPGNWTLDTISDLLLGIGRAELKIGLSYPFEQPAKREHLFAEQPAKQHYVVLEAFVPQSTGNYISVGSASRDFSLEWVSSRPLRQVTVGAGHDR